MARSILNALVVTLFFLTVLLTGAGNRPLPTQAATNPPSSVAPASDWQGVLAAHEAWKHTIREAGDDQQRWESSNSVTGLDVTFDARGGEVRPKSDDWRWGLELLGYGIGAAQRSLTGHRPRIATEGPRIGYAWDGNLEEWYQNRAEGLEHGYTIQKRPGEQEAAAPLELHLRVRGGLQEVEIIDAGRGATFGRRKGEPLLHYRGLTVLDATGRQVPARLESGGNDQLRLIVDEQTARYPLTIDPTIRQQVYLKASNTKAGDFFGHAVAISGRTLVIGAPGESSRATGIDGDQSDRGAPGAGAVYVFVRNPGGWSQQAYLKASNTDANDCFGCSVAISGETIVVGAPYEGSDASGINGDQTNNRAENSGAAYVFVRNGTTWRQQAYLKASTPQAEDQFGWSVAISGEAVIVGAPQAEGSGPSPRPGAAFLFVRQGASWNQQAKIDSSSYPVSRFGHSVAIDGEIAVVSKYNGAQAFERKGTTWFPQTIFDNSGWGVDSVGISGDTIVVGDPYGGTIPIDIYGLCPLLGLGCTEYIPGRISIYRQNGTTWDKELDISISNLHYGFFTKYQPDHEYFGWSVAISGDTLLVGVPGEDSNAVGIDGDQKDKSSYQTGAAFVYVRDGTTWTQQAYLKATNTGERDHFGKSVAISGDTIVIGAPSEDSSATSFFGDQADNSAPDAGAAYLFRTSEEINQLPTLTAMEGVTRQVGAVASRSIIATVGDAETPAGELAVTVNTGPSATVDGVTISQIRNDQGTITADVIAAPSAPAGVTRFFLTVDDGTWLEVVPLEVVIVRVSGVSAAISLPPGGMIGQGSILTITQTLINNLSIPAPTSYVATLPAGLTPLTCTSPIGSCTFGNSPASPGGAGEGEWQRQSTVSAQSSGQKVTWTGTIPPYAGVTVTYQVRVNTQAGHGTQYCVTTTIGGGPGPTSCVGVNHPFAGLTAGPGNFPAPMGLPNQQKPGSVLIYNVYTSSINQARSDTLISLTNAHPTHSTSVHLFFIDGASCSVADQTITLTQNQTVSFLASDIDPGITGYLVAVAVGPTGCPTPANFLIGTEVVRFESGHHAALPAIGISALGAGPACVREDLTATIAFDGVAYDELPRGVAVASLPPLQGGNSPLLIVNRIGGNLMSGADRLGPLTGLLFDDSEVARSFNLAGGVCQLRGMVGNNFPRTVPRYTTVIPAGRSGWMKFWAADDEAITGVLINEALSGLSGGYHLQTLTTTSAATLTIPVLPVR